MIKKALLTLEHLTIGYLSGKHPNRLFENINLSLLAGELVCFMGPNGIGKSTLIRTIAGLQKQLAGSIEFHSNEKHLNYSRNISVVLTDKISQVNLTAYEVVSFGRYPYLGWNVQLTEKDRRVIEEAFELIHIGHLRDQKIHSLSDGQLQMVMIARAITQDTPIILLDEPTAHLDLNNRVEIMKLLRQIARTTQKAILVSTHELDLALQLADWIWLAGPNQTLHSGFPEDLVLNGSFDKIFRFKGFDLKTGKVLHEAHTGKKIQVEGSGPEYLWTKNALERTGFEISKDSGTIVSIRDNDSGCLWEVADGTAIRHLFSLKDLIESL